jgi:aspartokinase
MAAGGIHKLNRVEKVRLAGMSSALQVMKFGGTSVGDATCIARTAQIVAKAARENPCVVVVSAMSGVTNRLIEAARKAATVIRAKAGI